jgi:hypothetical protein
MRPGRSARPARSVHAGRACSGAYATVTWMVFDALLPSA